MRISDLARNAARNAVCAAALLCAAAYPAAAQDPVPAAPEAPVEAAPLAVPAAPPAPATPAPAPEPVRNPTDVVARIGDKAITEADLTIAEKEFGAELGQVPAEQQRSVLIDALVNMELLAQAARDQGLESTPEFAARLEFARMQALRNSYVEKNIVDSVTPEELQKGYETLVLSQHKAEEQIQARHILVETKEAAEKIIADLKAGASFEELAKQSKDPSGQNGGDLGFFGRGQMVPPFEQAAFAMEPGALTEAPVQTEFGWHVIKVEGKRMSEPPPLADVEAELRNYLLRQKFETAMNELRAKYTVEIVGAPAAPAAAEPADGAAPTAVAPAPAEPAAEPVPAPVEPAQN